MLYGGVLCGMLGSRRTGPGGSNEEIAGVGGEGGSYGKFVACWSAFTEGGTIRSEVTKDESNQHYVLRLLYSGVIREKKTHIF